MSGLAQADIRALPLAAETVQCIVTSPPYFGLRDYGIPGQMGLERTVDEYLAATRLALAECWRVLRADGVCFWNIGDSYAGSSMSGGSQEKRVGGGTNKLNKLNGSVKAIRISAGLKPKDLMLIPERVGLLAQEMGWWVRSRIIWHKPNCMPESVQGSHFSRHRVTISEYERLSRLREAQRQDQDRASDLSSLSAGEVSDSEAPLSAEREGAGNSTRTGATRRRKGKATPVQPVQTGTIEPGEIRSDGKGKGDPTESITQIQGQRKGPASSRRASSKDQRPSFSDSSEKTSERALQPDREMEGEEAQGLRQAAGRNSTVAFGDSRGLARDSGTTQEPLPLLRQAESSNARPRNPVEQGGTACEGEHSPGLSELQLKKEGQADPALLVDCPGCPRCEKTGGYLFHMSAGRPTTDYETIWLFTKSASYHWDSEAVKEKSEGTGGGPFSPATHSARRATISGGPEVGRPEENGHRNLRTVWSINSAAYSDAHYATFPPALPRRCILAATSPRACGICGSPWERVTERSVSFESGSGKAGRKPAGKWNGTAQTESGTYDIRMGPVVSTNTLGWRPTCAHADDPGDSKCLVLDPFCGSGTTVAVAVELGRAGIGFDLSHLYLRDHARKRLAGTTIGMAI